MKEQNMGDIADEADKEVRDSVTEAIFQSKRPEVKRTGRCLYCNDVLPEGVPLFCDEFCRAEYENEELIRRKQFR
jgi:hypothetical protein